MSRGIIETATKSKSLFPGLEIRKHFEPSYVSEQPTLSDLILPGTEQPVSTEFACLLRLLMGSKNE